MYGSRQKILLFAIGWGVFCFLAYSNSFKNDFLIDDSSLIFSDPIRANPKLFGYYFIPDFKRFFNIENVSPSLYYRPLAQIVPILAYQMFGRNPSGYHLMNLMLLMLVGLFWFIFLRRLFRNASLAWLASLLFCIHPFSGIMVNYITASVYLVQLLAMVGGATAFLAFEERKSYPLLVLSVLGFLIALLCHETSLVFPLYLLAVLYFLRGYSFLKCLQTCGVYFLVMVFFLIFRFYFASFSSNFLEKIDFQGISFGLYLAGVGKLLFWYFSKLIFPEGIVFMWATPLLGEGFLRWSGPLVVGLILFIGAVFYAKKRLPLVAWAMTWIFLGLVPVFLACLYLLPQGLVIEPHWLFFSSIGFFVLLSQGIFSLKKICSRECMMAMTCIMVGFFVLSSRVSNRLWVNQKVYAQHWVNENPQFKNALYFLGAAYFETKEFSQARYYFLQALAGTSTDWQIYLNLGLMDYEEGRITFAKKHFMQAYGFFPNSAVIHNNLGLVCLSNHDENSAKGHFLKAIQYNPFLLEPRLNLASVYRDEKRYHDALKLYEKNLTLNPQDKNTLKLLASLYIDLKDFPKAIRSSEALLKMDFSPQELTSLGSLFGANNLNELAYAFFMKAYEKDPSFKDVYLELGKWYAHQGKLKIAVKFWREGRTLAPQDERFLKCLKQAENFLKNESH